MDLATIAVIVSILGGSGGFILTLIGIGKWINKKMSEKIDASETRVSTRLDATEKRICNDITEFKGDIVEIKSDIKECRDDTKETLEKLNEHLVVSGQAMAEFEFLKSRVSGHDDELEDLQKHTPAK